MKRKFTLAFAASVFALSLLTAPPRASAAAEIFLPLDGITGDSDGGGSSPAPAPSIWGFIVYLFT
jgi:hypothetical protein